MNSSLKETDCDKCKTCKYKEYFYSKHSFDETENPDVSTSEIETPLNNDCVHSTCDYNDKKTEDVKDDKFSHETRDDCLKKSENTSVLEALIPQFNYVFENYPKDDVLTGLLPDSRFVKISERNEEYSIGVIYKENEIKYICYAVLCDYNNPAPSELGPHYQWLPLDKEDPLSEGYYIVFQDAQDLKIVEL